MLCERPVVAAQAGGAVELVETGKTGWLVPPGDSLKLAAAITTCLNQPELTTTIAHQAKLLASKRFNLLTINQKIAQLLCRATTAKLK